MKNVSLVAFYGNKPSQLKELIQQLQERLARNKIVGDKFIPYKIEQVHGTIIGCEGIKTDSGIINQWFTQRRQETRSIDLEGLINYLQHEIDLPLTIRFGGYDRSIEYNYLSRNQHLYFRSFQLQATEKQVIPILIGWSWENKKVSLAVESLRRSFQEFNLLHKYHSTTDSIDNDFYLRLGTINCQLPKEEINAIASSTALKDTASHIATKGHRPATRCLATDIRDILEAQPALCVPINKEDLAFVQYQDLSLTPEKTKVISISKITPEDLNWMYPTNP